jgi:hypothetical protein
MLQPGEFDALHPSIHTLRCTALGAVVLALVIAPLGYFFVYALWDAIRWTARRTMPVVKITSPRAVELPAPPVAERKKVKPALAATPPEP